MALAVVEELRRLVAWPTVSNRPLVELAAHMAQTGRGPRVPGHPLRAVGSPGSAASIASIGPEDADGGLVMSGHMDVVPTEGQPWSSDPFRMEERDGRLYGRGTADMKGFLAATTSASQRIPRDAWKQRLVLIWTHDEGVGCLGSQALVDAWTSGPMPKACGSASRPASASCACTRATSRSRSWSTARPPTRAGRTSGSTRSRARRTWSARSGRSPPSSRRRRSRDLPEMERPWVAVNVAEIERRRRGERGAGPVLGPDRLPAAAGPGPARGLGAAAGPRSSGSACRRPVGRPRAPGHAVDVHPRRHRARAAARRPRRRHRHGAASFATDGGNLAKLGMEPLVFGPGAIEVAHMADEHVAVADLVRAVNIVEAVVRQRCC